MRPPQTGFLILLCMALLVSPSRGAEPKAPEGPTLDTLFKAATVERKIDRSRLPYSIRHADVVTRANRAVRAGKLADAIEEYGAALELAEKDTYSRFLLGCMLFETGQYPKAAEAFARVNALEKNSSASVMLERLSAQLAKDADRPLLETAVSLLHQARKEHRIRVGTAWASADPLIEQLSEESKHGVGVFVVDGELLSRGLGEEGATPRQVAAVAYFMAHDLKQVVDDLVALTDRPDADQDLLRALYLLSQNRPGFTLAQETLKKLQALDPKNGYYDLMYATEKYGRSMDPDLRKMTFAEIRAGQSALWEAVLDKPKYESHRQELVDAYGELLAASGYPFHRFTRQAVQSLPHSLLVTTLSKRLHRDIEDAAAAGALERARKLVNECRTIALKVLADHRSIPSANLAATVFGEALKSIPPPEPEGDTVAENWDGETPAALFVSEVRAVMNRERDNGLLIATGSRIPIPRLQTAAIEELAARERRIVERVEKLITEWKIVLK